MPVKLPVIAAGKLFTSPPANVGPPGDATAQAALGYLHANCSNCHNPSLVNFTAFSMRLKVTDTTVEMTDTFQQAVGQMALVSHGGNTIRIVPGDPSASVVSYRMGQRTQFVQMPPIATEIVDDVGLAAVDAWITALPP